MRFLKALGFAILCWGATVGMVSQAMSQQYRWDGTGPFCNGTCRPGEREITRAATPPGGGAPPAYYGPQFGSACATGTKALCQITGGQRYCRWSGTAPFCKGSCQGNEVASQAPAGSSSGRKCFTGHKVYCCSKS